MPPLWERIVRRRGVRGVDTAQASAPAQEPPPAEVLTKFVNARLVTPSGSTELGELWVQGDKVVDPCARFWQRGEAKFASDRRVDCQGMLLAPGFLDVLNYGVFGVTFGELGGQGEEAEAEAAVAMRRVRARLARHGVTGFCPTIGPCAPTTCRRLLERLTAPSGPGEASVLGVHLDGPFLSPGQVSASPTTRGGGLPYWRAP